MCGEREGVRLLFKGPSGAAPCARGQGKSGLGTDAEVGAAARRGAAGNRAELGDERDGPLGRGLARALGRPSRRRGERGEREQCWASAWHCSKRVFLNIFQTKKKIIKSNK